MLSEADKIFEALGYKKYENEDKIIYIFEGCDHIEFHKAKKLIKVYIWNDGAVNIAKTLTIKELQAINEKCRELGWL